LTLQVLFDAKLTDSVFAFFQLNEVPAE